MKTVEKYCLSCKKKYKIPLYREKTASFCSNECRIKSRIGINFRLKENRIIESGDHYEIITTNGNIIFDKEEKEKVDLLTWSTLKATNTKYAICCKKINGENKYIYFHRYILGLNESSMFVDHINHNGLDNRKCNLRIVTASENMMNQYKQKRKKSSIYKGVCFDKKKNLWESYIHKNNKKIFLGYFKNQKDAAIAYNEKAKILYGKYAVLNEEKN